MSADKYPSMFLREMETIVYIPVYLVGKQRHVKGLTYNACNGYARLHNNLHANVKYYKFVMLHMCS